MNTNQRRRISIRRLRQLLRYDPQTGALTWAVDRNTKTRTGDLAGGVDAQGYVRVKIDDRTYQGHRLAWALQTGRWPRRLIDHANGRRADNRWANLREADESGNCQNLGRTAANTSGVVGVSWKASHGAWVAQIQHRGRVRHLGLFKRKSAAVAARRQAKRNLHTFQPVDPDRAAVSRRAAA